MKVKRILSALLATAFVVPCVFNTQIAARGEEVYYIPDFPQDVIDEFNIDWTGLTSNQYAENTEFDEERIHNKFYYDGGYACYTNFFDSVGFSNNIRWHENNSFTAFQSKEFPFPEYTDKIDLSLELKYDVSVKEEGEFKIGSLLELNNGRDELFVIEGYSSATDFSDYEKLGSYISENAVYDVYIDDEKKDDESVVRYYSVNTEGLITKDSKMKERKCNINEHLSNLNTVADTGKVLNRYGILAEGKGGAGSAYNSAKLIGSYFMLPEEERPQEDNGDPVATKSDIIKNYDGYRYSFQSYDSRQPLKKLEDGRYTRTTHENDSYFIPLKYGKAIAYVSEGMSSSVFVGKEYDGKTPLLDHSYQYNYTYETDYDVDLAATVWMFDPYVRVDFVESNYEPTANTYIGAVELNGEQYRIYEYEFRDDDTFPLFDTQYQGYLFIHKKTDTSEDESGVKKRSVPISSLLESAKVFGIESGNLCRMGLNVYRSPRNFYLDITENNIIEDAPFEPGTVMVDATQVSSVTLGNYKFSSDIYSPECGYMYGYENGLFSAGVTDGDWTSFKAGFDKSANAKYLFDIDENITVDYKIENKFEDKYQFGYQLNGKKGLIYKFVYVIENSRNYSTDDILDFYNITPSPGKSEKEELGTITVDDHEYEVIKYYNVVYGDFLSTQSESIYCIRKDQDDGEILEGSINFNEFIEKTCKDFMDGTFIDGVYLTFQSYDVNGTVEALKNDISFEGKDYPRTIVGDLNGDMCVDVFDVIYAKKVILNDGYMTDRGDLDQNGKFEIADVVLLQSYVLGKINEFPRPQMK